MALNLWIPETGSCESQWCLSLPSGSPRLSHQRHLGLIGGSACLAYTYVALRLVGSHRGGMSFRAEIEDSEIGEIDHTADERC